MKKVKSLMEYLVRVFLLCSFCHVCLAGKESGNTRGDISSPHFAKGSKCRNTSFLASEYYPKHLPKVEEQLQFIRKISLVMYLKIKEEIERTYVCQAGNMKDLEAYSGQRDQPAIIEMYGQDVEPIYYNNLMEPLRESVADEFNSRLWDMYKNGQIGYQDFNEQRAVYLPQLDNAKKFNNLYLNEFLMFGIAEDTKKGSGYSEDHRAGVFIFEMLHPVFRMAGYQMFDKTEFLNAVLERNYNDLLSQFEKVGALDEELKMTQDICLLSSNYCVESLLLFPEEVRFSVLVDESNKSITKVLESIIQNGGIEKLAGVFPEKDLVAIKKMFHGVSFSLESCGYTVPDSQYFLVNRIRECISFAIESLGFEISSKNRFDIYEARRWLTSIRVYGTRGLVSIEDFRAGIGAFISLTARSRKSWELVVQEIGESFAKPGSANDFYLEILKSLDLANLPLKRKTKKQ
ncbi:MAG: hypothetical protein VX642_00990 [Bdellovibrionota bacterium]|nr:hypothetical protein [Bdellovibrionota bacterium]